MTVLLLVLCGVVLGYMLRIWHEWSEDVKR